MRAYQTSTPEHNPNAAPAVPSYRWSYERRARMFGERNPEFSTGRGRARRWRRELSVRAGLRAVAAVLAGDRTLTSALRLDHSPRALLYAPLDGRGAPVVFARERVKTLLDALATHGPGSGWGIPQPPPAPAREAKWTPYEVPKRAEKNWRWWRARLRALLNLMRHLDALWRKPVPLHRSASSTTPGEKPGAVLGGGDPETGTRLRDQFHPWIAAADERMRRHLGM